MLGNSESKNLDASKLHVAIVASRFNVKVCDGLVEGAVQELLKMGLPDNRLTLYRVPGAFELGLLAKTIAKSLKPDAVVCLGAVIRGDTAHFDYVCQGATLGIQQAMLDTGTPMAFGLLTTDTEEQAVLRSSPDENNKGREAARCAVEMATLTKEIG